MDIEYEGNRGDIILSVNQLENALAGGAPVLLNGDPRLPSVSLNAETGETLIMQMTDNESRDLIYFSILF